jgi:hypothetical protein
MTENEQRQMAASLLDLLWQMEQILKDCGRQLTAHDDGHRLETETNNEPL